MAKPIKSILGKVKRRTPAQSLLIIVGVTFGVLILGTIILVVDGLRDELGKADTALVLGSKVELDGRPSARLRARLDRTLALYREGYFPFVIVSGGVGKEGFDEAAVMKDYLVVQGIPADRIKTDSGGVTTFASARNTRLIAQKKKFGSVLVVSQYFHLPRARLALKRFGMHTVYSAHAHYYEGRDVYSSLREAVGYADYFFRQYPEAARE